eukprot:Gb_16991 [translate_table: standard]
MVKRTDLDDLSGSSPYIPNSCQVTFTALSTSPRNLNHVNSSNVFFSNGSSKGSTTWLEEKLPPSNNLSPSKLVASKTHYKILKTGIGDTIQGYSTVVPAAAWVLVIVTAGCGGEIKSFQNYGLPVHL